MSFALLAYLIAIPPNLLFPNFLSAPKVNPEVLMCFGFCVNVASWLPNETSPCVQKDHVELLILEELEFKDAWSLFVKEARTGLCEFKFILKLFKSFLFLFLFIQSKRLKIVDVL